jgi:hypothetical protein
VKGRKAAIKPNKTKGKALGCLGMKGGAADVENLIIIRSLQWSSFLER